MSANIDYKGAMLLPRQSTTTTQTPPTLTQTTASPTTTSFKVFDLSSSLSYVVIFGIITVVLILVIIIWKKCFSSSRHPQPQSGLVSPYFTPTAPSGPVYSGNYTTTYPSRPIARPYEPPDDSWRSSRRNEGPSPFEIQQQLELQRPRDNDLVQERRPNALERELAERAIRFDAEAAIIIPDKRDYRA
ncbi:hypothetical protein K432DRAFT_410477 [Lepidopterella palustris CBS 459.81]|uniref:Uncharacterized protein n=1 Tax=Lepidopterella palustris CBS 459.81 TaxID=1314670 RepID=A0A8E2J9G5_9PEZI|nr:hypothetical protein K432DRAFT_410477 [Lepidopterella palustris CBS 459.81]